MSDTTNETPEPAGSGWAQGGTPAAPAPTAAAPTPLGEAPVTPQYPAAAQAPAATPPAHAAPRRAWPFAPESTQPAQPPAPQPPAPQPAPQPAGYGAAPSWAVPGGANGERQLAAVGAPQGYAGSAPAPAAPAPNGSPLPPPPAPAGSAFSPYPATHAQPTEQFSTASMPTFDVTPQGGGPAGPPYAGPRAERRGPGWFAVFGSSLAAAVLASGMTVGITSALDDDSPAAAPAATRAQSAPVVPGGSTSSPDWKAVADAVAPSVVAVQVSTGQGGGQGSGVVLDTSGNIVTNNHVVADAEKVVVVLSDGREFDATVVGTDPSTDLAVIRMTKPPKDLTAATLGDSDQVTVGSPVMAIGNPLGLSHTVTTGIVSAVNRPVTAQSQDGNGSDQVVTNAIQTDASINPGNSGGALLDAQGRVIGITSSIATLGSGSGLFPGQSSQSGSIGLGFAIPSNEAKSVSEQLIASDGKTVEHAWLGVQLQDSRVEVDGARRQAAVLGEVTAGSPAAKAGLKKGDAVIAMNDEAIAGADSLVAQVREKRANESVKLTIVRDGKTQDVTVTLGVRPDNVG